jgi:hypothetical protein
MRTDLRANPQRSMGRYWLAISDSVAFKLVRSTISIAEELRRDIAEHLQLLALLNAPEMALVLLTMAEAGWGKNKAVSMVGQFVEVNRSDPMKKAKAFFLVRQAVDKMPVIVWPTDKLGARRELMEELERLAMAARSTMPLRMSKAEEREIEWRESLASRRREELDARAAAGK